MGISERCEKGQSFQFAAKNLAASAITFLILFSACSHKQSSVPSELQKALSESETPAKDVSPMGVQLTKIGDNHSPYLSKDGKKIAFVSQKRPSHAHAQIYYYDLDSLKERRITYQDGECLEPALLPNGRDVVYASTTDELKERPILFRKKKETSPLPPSEIYISEISGTDIGRLTQRQGYDGRPQFHPTKLSTILYSQFNGEHFSIWQLSRDKKQTGLFLAKKDRSIVSLSPSPSGKQWAWIEKKSEKNGDWPNTEVYVGTIPLKAGSFKGMELPIGQYSEVTWINEDKIVMAAKILGKKNSQFYSLEMKTQCLQNLFETDTELASPQPHPERDGIIFTSTSNGKSDLYYKSIPPNSECLDWKESNNKK